MNVRAAGADETQPAAPDHFETTPRAYTLLAILAIALATWIAFSGAIANQFVDWDDNHLLLHNDKYHGLSFDNLGWMFSTTLGGHYQPLTWLSFGVDWLIWGGVNAAGVHLTNVLLHAATAIGFFFVARRLLATGMTQLSHGVLTVAALTAALIFAVHPLRVESVAWATERRDVLSGALLMPAIALYLRFAVSPRTDARRLFFIGALFFFCLSLLSKAAALTLPAVLLVLDWYPLRRFGAPLHRLHLLRSEPRASARADPPDERRFRNTEHRDTKTNFAPAGKPSIKSVLLEKLIFGLPAMGVALVAIAAQAGSGALWDLRSHPATLRIGNAFYGIVFYVWKTIWPSNLIPLYEQPVGPSPLGAVEIVSALLVLIVCIALWVRRRSWPAVAAAWAVYLVLLSPVLGLAQSGPQRVADRYSYLPCLAFAVLGGAWIARRDNRSARHGLVARLLPLGCVLAAAGVWTSLTRTQVGVWKNSMVLWSTVIERAPNTGLAHANMAVLLNSRGEYPSACEHSKQALSILPGNRTAHLALARCSTQLADFQTAREHLRTADAIRPNDPATLSQLAWAESELGRDDEAERLYRRVVQLVPAAASARFDLGGFLASRRRYAEADGEFRAAIDLDPDFMEAYFRLAVVLLQQDRWSDATVALQKGLARQPQHVRLTAKLALTLASAPNADLRDVLRALTLANEAFAMAEGGSIIAYEALATALAANGRFDEAGERLDQLLARENFEPSEPTRRRLQRLRSQFRNHEPPHIE